MKSLQAEFVRFINAQQLIPSGDNVLLAVSGGIDSMVMAKLFNEQGFRFGIAHVNFNLRGEESAADAGFVARMAKRWKVPFHSLEADTRAYGRAHKLSLQEAAREIRYKWFEEVAIRHGYDSIATAHHLDDSIETFFINLLRGTGIHGLSGIPVRNGKIIRPMLFATSAMIRAYASKNRISFRQDSTNAKDDYLRNRIRHHLIPILEELQPGLQQVMAGNFSRLRFAGERLDERLNDLHRALVYKSKEGKTLSIPELLSFKQPELLLHELLRLEDAPVHEPEKLLVTGKPGKIFNAGNKKITRDRNKLIVEDKVTIQQEDHFISTLPTTFELQGGSYHFEKRKYKKGEERSADPKNLMLDAAKLLLPLHIRAWQPGDRIRPLGMERHKKISDVLTDLKLSLATKSQTLVAVSGSEICCILGVRISDDYKVTESTKEVVLITRQS